MKDLARALDVYYDDPVAFCEDILGVGPDTWQRRVLRDLADHPKVSVRSGQGVGKTALEAWAIIWFLVCRPYARVVATAPTMHQLYNVLWAEVAKWLENSLVKKLLKWTKTKIYMVGDEHRWFAVAKTAARPENMQGFHEDHMLIVVDEASGIADPIMEAILGTLTGWDNKLLLCGNPNRLEGVFYDSHHGDRDKYRTHKVSSFDSARTSRDNIDMLLRKYGRDSDVARVRIYGDFPRSTQDALISLESVELAMSKPPPEDELRAASVLHVGADVARFGDDKSVFSPRVGAVALPFLKYSKKSTMETAGLILQLCMKYLNDKGIYKNIKRCTVRVDDTGVGGGVTDRLNEVIREERLPITVVPVNNGAAAKDEYYHNLGAQVWGHIRELLEQTVSGSLQGKAPEIYLPQDNEMVKQLIARRYHMTSRGKIQLESKQDMKKRGLESPDIADAMTLAFYDPPTWIY